MTGLEVADVIRKRIVRHFLVHEWRALLRRNFAGLVAGVVPLISAPVVGFICASITETLDELGEYGVALQPNLIVLAGLTGLALFPVLYAVFMVSDTISLETELGTIELVAWSPVNEKELLIGKSMLSLLFNYTVGILNFMMFGLSYSVASNILLQDHNPWPFIALASGLLVVVLAMAVMIGVLISALSLSSKGAATVSLLVGSLVMVVEVGLASGLAALGLPVIELAWLVFVVNFAAMIALGKVILAKFGHRESYFLLSAQRRQHDA